MIINSIESMHTVFTQLATQRGLSIECDMAGTFNAQIAIVGEAPGNAEVERKTPLIGGSGSYLFKHLQPIGVTRINTYVTNVVKRRLPTTNSQLAEGLRNEEKHNWVELLNWELSQLPNLRYVIILGGLALEALHGQTSITNWRGSVIRLSKLPTTPQALITYNPANVFYAPKTEVIFRLDIAKLKMLLEGSYSDYKINQIINPSYDAANQFISACIKKQAPISCDIETSGGETVCIGLATSPTEAMCINFRDINDNRFSPRDEAKLKLRIQTLFKECPIIFQNAMYDCTWLWYKDRLQVFPYYDTLLAHHTLYPGLPHDLGFMTAQYTTHPYYKDERLEWREKGDIDSYWRYNCTDAAVTYQVYESTKAELENAKLTSFFFDHVMHLAPHLISLSAGGVLCDLSLKQQAQEDLNTDVAKLFAEIVEQAKQAVGDPTYEFNPNSSAQLADLLFKRLKLIGRGASTNAENRQKILDHPKTPDIAKEIIIKIDKYKKEHKFLSTYANSAIDTDGRVRCQYKQFGVTRAPGRLSSSQSAWGTGMNLQNQPRRAQSMFIADPGCVLGYFDLSQAEARVVAWLANISSWKQQFEKARADGVFDCHRALASDMWGIPYDNVPTADIDSDGNFTRRYIAKRCRHGLNYRMGYLRLATVTGLSIALAKQAYDIYHRTSPEVKRWWAAIEEEIRTKRVLYNAFGRPLPMLEKITPEALESIIAFKPQSTIGDKVSQVIYKSHEDTRWPDKARILLNIHDALICEAPPSKIKTCLYIMKKYAEEPIILNNEPLIIPAECKISIADEAGMHRWSNMKKVDLS